MPAPKKRVTVPASGSSVFLYNLQSSRGTQDSQINAWLRWKSEVGGLDLVTAENLVQFGRMNALSGIKSFKAYTTSAFNYERSRWNSLIIPHGETVVSLKQKINSQLNSIDREVQYIFKAEDPKKANLIWNFTRFTPQHILNLQGGRDMFGMYIALASGLRGIAIESIHSLKYVVSDDPRITSIAENYDQTVIGLSFVVQNDKVKLDYLVPRTVTLPCTCYVFPQWCPVHGNDGKVRNPLLLPSQGVSRPRLLALTNAWTSDGTMHSHRRTFLVHLACYLSVYVGLDMTSFLAASKLNYTCDQFRRRMNQSLGWSFQSETAGEYTVDAPQRMVNKQIFPGYRPIFDFFRFGDLVTAVLQQSDPMIQLEQAIRDQPATKFPSWNVKYGRADVAGRLDLNPASLKAFPNGLVRKDDILKSKSTLKISSSDDIIKARPEKGQIDAQLDCFDHTKSAMKKLEMNVEAANAGPDGFVPKFSNSALDSSFNTNKVLTPDLIVDTNFVPAPVRKRGRPKFKDEVNQLLPNAGVVVKERSRSGRKTISAYAANKLVEDEFPQFKGLTGRMFVNRGKPKKNPGRADFNSAQHEKKYWALRKLLEDRNLKIGS
jgi:hypothetical protein